MSKFGKRSRRRHLASSSGAKYQPQQFVITFEAATPYLREVTNRGDLEFVVQDKRYFHVFVHEYWHYWHNFSTTAGMKQFFAMQDLVAFFTRTLDEKAIGTSLGASVLGDERARLAELARMSANIQGQGAPNDHLLEHPELIFDVENAYIETANDTYNDTIVSANRAMLEVSGFADGENFHEKMELGATAIEEGIAILVEEHCAHQIEGALLEPAPEFPYRVLEITVKHLARRECSPFAVAALGTLALLSTEPGPGLILLAREFGKRLDDGNSEADALDALIAETRDLRVSAADGVKHHMQSLVARHQERGAVEVAMHYLQMQSEAALRFRIDHPVTDLAYAFNEDPIKTLATQIERFPPCDVLQMRDGDEWELMRDGFVPLHRFAPLDNGLTLSDCMRSLQAQQDYLAAHSDENWEIRDSTSSIPHACPYFTSCSVGVRLTDPTTCWISPWKALDRSSEHTCWYGGGVAATLGPVIASGLGNRAAKEERERVRKERIQLAAYYRWRDRGGLDAPEAALDDWLWAEAQVTGKVTS